MSTPREDDPAAPLRAPDEPVPEAATSPDAAALRRPLRFRRRFLEKVWGGRALAEAPGIELEPDGPVGETWELYDLGDESAVVAEGPLAGRTLRSLLRVAPEALLGRATPGPADTFPLIVKFLDAAKPLSVQVHPDAKAAELLGHGARSKDEMWYVLAARPKSCVYLGLRPEVSPTEFARAARGPAVCGLLHSWPVRAGDAVLVPAGSVHSIGEGVTLLEVQESSDTTYRLFDWGRKGLDGKPRPVHVEQALLATSYGAEVPGPRRPEPVDDAEGNARAPLAECAAFRAERIELEYPAHLDTGGVAVIYVVVAGRGRLEPAEPEDLAEPGAAGVDLAPGDTWLVPAIAGPHRIEGDGDGLTVVRVETKAR